jgi:hypothetical protein
MIILKYFFCKDQFCNEEFIICINIKSIIINEIKCVSSPEFFIGLRNHTFFKRLNRYDSVETNPNHHNLTYLEQSR